MVEWNTLRHAYGSAVDVPALLTRLSPDASAPVWGELWSRLCHQGTVYSASYAALPALEAAARRWPAEQRLAALSLAAGIVAATDALGGPRAGYIREFESTIASLKGLAEESLARPGWSRADFVYLLQAAIAFAGDTLWGARLDGLIGGELWGRCPTCGADLYLVIGEYGFFTAGDEWLNRPETARVPIETADGDIAAPGQWLLDRAAAAGQTDVAAWIRRLFGTSRCPRCGSAFTIPEAVEEAA